MLGKRLVRVESLGAIVPPAEAGSSPYSIAYPGFRFAASWAILTRPPGLVASSSVPMHRMRMIRGLVVGVTSFPKQQPKKAGPDRLFRDNDQGQLTPKTTGAYLEQQRAKG